jgi:Tol biopolymer transport system component
MSALLVLAAPAPANFPGQNGKIAFIRVIPGQDSPTDAGIFTVNPDGTGAAKIYTGGSDPAWSPDGKKLAFISGGIVTMNADGTGLTHVTDYQRDYICASDPAWSPDGQKIAFTHDCATTDGFSEIFVINIDGTGGTNVSNTPGAQDGPPSWSPDGQKIAFSNPGQVTAKLYTVNPDGTGRTPILTGSLGTQIASLDWSPDATRLVLSSNLFAPNSFQAIDLYTVNRDGSGLSRILEKPGLQYAPTWAPDGQSIAFHDCPTDEDCGPVDRACSDVYGCWGDLYAVKPDGTSLTPITTSADSDTDPSWQPLPINSYPRPKGATPVIVALTIAYKPCTAPDRDHNPPLSAPSCSQHQMTSDYLTVGTGDANGMLPRSLGSVRYDAVLDKPATPADEADVKLQLSMTDVFTKTLADYAGELSADVSIRLTDKDNTPSPGGPGAATVQEFPLPFFASCTPTADTTIGSDCAAATTANAVIPGLVKGGLRSIWQLGQVKVFDGGADSYAATTADNTLFADEGIFAP